MAVNVKRIQSVQVEKLSLHHLAMGYKKEYPKGEKSRQACWPHDIRALRLRGRVHSVTR